MTKTSTPTNTAGFAAAPAEEITTDQSEQDELFYNSIKPQLDELVRDPSAETINKILAYNKKK